MRLILMAITISASILSVFASVAESMERTAYIFQEDVDSLVSVPLEGPSSSVVLPDPVASFGWGPAGSTLLPDGRILTMNISTDQLVAVTPATGEVEALCTMSIDVQGRDDLFWGIDGSLLYYRSTGGMADLYHLDPTTCSATLQATVSGIYDTIESHLGQYYAGGNRAFWRIDPHTYDETMIIDFSGLYTGCSVWGLASVGENLWRGTTCWVVGGGQASHSSFIELADPVSGGGEVFAGLSHDPLFAPYFGLQVIDQPAPPTVPVLMPAGIAVFVLVLGVAAVVSLRGQ